MLLKSVVLLFAALFAVSQFIDRAPTLLVQP